MDDDDFLTDYEVWEREDDYQREVWLGIQLEWEAEDEADSRSGGEQ